MIIFGSIYHHYWYWNETTLFSVILNIICIHFQYDVRIQCSSDFDCVNNGQCVSGQCYCREGFEPAGAECRDIDECQTNPCGANANCRNIPGSYTCLCNVGYIGRPPQTTCKGILGKLFRSFICVLNNAFFFFFIPI